MYVEILLNNASYTIGVYEGDNAEDIASKFAREHNLDQNKTQKLMTMIHSQIMHYK